MNQKKKPIQKPSSKGHIHRKASETIDQKRLEALRKRLESQFDKFHKDQAK
jgi:hypothetical protein